MRIYVLGGFAPDPAEQCVCTLAEVFTDEDKARERFNEIKRDVEELLEDNYSNGRLAYYSVDSHEVRHNEYTLGDFSAKASITPGNDKHVDMWRDWSTINIGTGCGFMIDSSNVGLELLRPSDFKVASISISVKEI